MIFLPLACTVCNRRVVISSEESIPRCPDCSGKMRPGGKVMTPMEFEEDKRQESEKLRWSE